VESFYTIYVNIRAQNKQIQTTYQWLSG